MYMLIEVFIDTSTQVLCSSYISGNYILFRLKPLASTSIKKSDYERLLNRVMEGVHTYMVSEVSSSEK